METKVIKSACSANYLNMMKQMAVAQENWSFLYPYNPDNPQSDAAACFLDNPALTNR